MLLQKFPKTVSYTVIMAVIPKINENSVSGGGGMRSVRYPMKIISRAAALRCHIAKERG